jgi:hypothetical protein
LTTATPTSASVHDQVEWEQDQPSVIIQMFERLNSLPSQLETTVELSSLLQARHAAAQSTISALESKVTALESLVASSPVTCRIYIYIHIPNLA